jgi:hypothetical protein
MTVSGEVEGTTTQLICDVAISVVNLPFLCQLKVSSATYMAEMAGKTVQIVEGNRVLGTDTLNFEDHPSRWQAAMYISGLTVGEHTLQAKYLGSGSTQPSQSAPWTFTVNDRTETTTELGCSVLIAAAGMPFHCMVMVTGTYYSTGVSNGTVDIVEGNNVLVSTPTTTVHSSIAAVEAYVTVPGLSAGTHELKAVFSGSQTSKPSESVPHLQEVQ